MVHVCYTDIQPTCLNMLVQIRGSALAGIHQQTLRYTGTACSFDSSLPAKQIKIEFAGCLVLFTLSTRELCVHKTRASQVVRNAYLAVFKVV